MCNQNDGKFQLTKFTKSLQLAFLSAARQAEKNPAFLVRSIHYLYFLIIAKKFGAHIIELNNGLDALLHESSALSNVIEQEDTLPELRLMFEHFRVLSKES